MNLKQLKLIIESELRKLKESQKLLLEVQYYDTLMGAKMGCNGDCPGQACSQALNIQNNQFYNICGAPIQGGGNVAPMNPDRGTPVKRPFRPKRKMRRR